MQCTAPVLSNAGRNDPHHGNDEEGTWGRGSSLVDCSSSQQCRRALHSSQELFSMVKSKNLFINYLILIIEEQLILAHYGFLYLTLIRYNYTVQAQ
jgi:hypothetical protein